jgi:hypothetical protein
MGDELRKTKVSRRDNLRRERQGGLYVAEVEVVLEKLLLVSQMFEGTN